MAVFVGVRRILFAPYRLATFLMRWLIQCATSPSTHPTALAPREMGEGNSPREILRYIVDRLRPVRASTCLRRKIVNAACSSFAMFRSCSLALSAPGHSGNTWLSINYINKSRSINKVTHLSGKNVTFSEADPLPQEFFEFGE